MGVCIYMYMKMGYETVHVNVSDHLSWGNVLTVGVPTHVRSLLVVGLVPVGATYVQT